VTGPVERAAAGARSAWRPLGRRLALALGLATGALGLTFALDGSDRPLRPLTLTPGPLSASRALVARELAGSAAARGLEVRLVDVRATEDGIREVEAGRIDLALVSGVWLTSGHERLRSVAPLYVEALHLLIRKRAAGPSGFAALRGLAVDLGPVGSAGAALAESVLAFAGLRAGGPSGVGDYQAVYLDHDDLAARVERAEWNALPDAILNLATVPSKLALALVRSSEYALVPLPFADAYRLGRLLRDPALAQSEPIDGASVRDTAIPPFTYATDPPVPAEPLHTLGARLLLVANEAVPAPEVERMLEAVFESRFAHGEQPALSREALAVPQHLPPHPGARSYFERERPFLTGSEIDELNNSLSIVGALAGSAIFLWQWRRQRARQLLDQAIGAYLLRLTELERRVATLELSATLELEPLAELGRAVLELKRDALEGFASGELGGHATIAELLAPINSLRDQVAGLLLHVRENIEEQAEAEGRSARALWSEAISKPPDASPGSDPQRSAS
jgi:TRAP-type uncharacterized transport system substrate-binding protein